MVMTRDFTARMGNTPKRLAEEGGQYVHPRGQRNLSGNPPILSFF